MKRMLVPAAALFAATLVGCATNQNAHHQNAQSGGSTDVLTKAEQQAMTPAQVVADLKAGNRRFVNGNLTNFDYLGQAKATAGGQAPKAIVLSCLDSRVIPEIALDQGIGDIFVGRVAGNFENTDMLGSMEFGTAVAGAKVIVVLGHTECGAIMGAIDQAKLGNLTETLANIEPAIQAVPHAAAQRASSNRALVNDVIEANVRQTMRDITGRSEVLADRVRNGELIVIGGVYDLASGRVDWIDG